LKINYTMKDTYTIQSVRQNSKISTYYYKNGHLINLDEEKSIWGDKISPIENIVANQIDTLKKYNEMYHITSIIII